MPVTAHESPAPGPAVPARRLQAAAGAPWRPTGSGVFPHAALVDGTWWVLRLNDFPDHPLHTLFADGRRIADLDDDLPLPGGRQAGGDTAPALTAAERATVLDLMAGLGPYGAEHGTPCTDDWCTCEILTDAYVRREAG
ncbi:MULTISPECIES: hypothetical protein [Streptomyces]|uniref:hypothetical protein n=1 Tax=Streptomyces TaxID=1883 RepID=UPI001677B7F1|nr:MULTISPECIES: hypothetical protein [Streptomyces]MBD3578112.1 hypothetical protein [Streptomyces sp. KD18]GGT02005.1 hypothetical protein GCM10010286_28670 [Streptomyces toxytricini]